MTQNTSLVPLKGSMDSPQLNPEMRAMVKELATQLAAQQIEQDPRNSVMVSEIVRAYLGFKRSQAASGQLAPSSMADIDGHLRLYLDWFGDGPVSRCRQSDLADWLETRTTWKSPWTRISATVNVSAAFTWAAARGMIRVSPYARIKKPSLPSTPRLRIPDEDMEPGKRRRKKRHRLPRYLKWSEAEKLMDWCAAQVAKARTPWQLRSARRDDILVRVGLYLGLRISEIIGLDVTDINLEDRVAFVREGKGCRDRMVAMPAKLVPHLQACIAGRTAGVLIVGWRGGRLNDRTCRWRLARAARLAGLTAHVHPHILRHSYATRLLHTGSDIRAVQALLGHSDLSTTAIYLDVDVSRFAAHVDRL
jgi:integrase